MAIKKNTNDLINNQVNQSNIKVDNDNKTESQKLNTVLPPIRISTNHKKVLETYFKSEKGLSLSSGVRMVVFEYMKENNLI